ncbi:AAA family ATPase [Xanthomarina gelatinilytica]|uniref:AAA family ATPase n=1 Tax=Xanthomarina gelatinilytica TaxID=1137281 RepID=UPI003AA91CC9
MKKKNNMPIKIQKLSIKNFKVYKSKEFDFVNSNLIVFDGPNGFGKTTVFDALELVFTGRIRRYVEISKRIIDNREARRENPLYHNQGDDGPINIKIQFLYNDETYVIARQTPDLIDLSKELNFKEFKLYQLDNFESSIDEANLKEDDFVKTFLGENYLSDFEFLNYIEQEDSLYLLKHSEKEKKESISYLFNTNEFEKKIYKYEKIVSKLKELISQFNSDIKLKQEKIDNLKKSLVEEKEIQYNPLLTEKEFIWDKELVDFSKVDYYELINQETGLLTKIEELVKQKELFYKYQYNRKVDKIIKNESILFIFFYYENFRESEEQIAQEKELYEQSQYLIDGLEEFSFEKMMEDEYEIINELKERIRQEPVYDEYQKALTNLQQIFSSANAASKVYVNFLSSRKTIINQLEQYHKHIDKDGICPLCGYDWETTESLVESIKKQTNELEDLSNNLNDNLIIARDNFLENEADDLILYLRNMTSQFLFKAEYFEDEFFNIEIKNQQENLRATLAQLDINYIDFLNKAPEIPNDDEAINKFLNIIRNKKTAIPDNTIKPYFDTIFERYFNEEKDILDAISVDEVENKKKYIKYIFSLFQNTSIQEAQLEIRKLSFQNINTGKALLRFQNILKSLNDTLKWYNDKLIKDIELLFHIYSGRIVQDYFGGRGLFIDNKNDKIKFVTTPNKTYDAIFSMSNGQLAALVISFTLALNKKYSTNQLLFIDDPVQSMDDMNTAGFVEVLRNDFSDRQIFLSTHEESMSTYVRYKFKKFNLSTKREDVNNFK